ncbi:MAG: hypothetical protein KatS3mg027_1786 [Bacteroidia bacterium]|nr:MAG: hypothetical protein KatS3mg027_1786 [Bacteroidia bacterium]
MMRFAKNFFTKEEQQKIIQCIQEAEKNTSAEIRVHLENFCFINPIKRAEKVFIKNKMHLTQHRNAVLFYFAVISRKMAIIGDKGIYEKVDRKFWDDLVNQLIQSLKNNSHTADVLCNCIIKVGEVLAQYFPPTEENPNELSNEISF